MKNIMLVRGFALLAIATSLSACGQGSWVTNVGVSTSTQAGDHYAEVTTTLNTSNVSLMGLQLPIYSGTTVIGSVLVTPTVNSLSTLTIEIDVDKVVKLPTGTPVTTLPNGDAIPIVNATFHQFPIGTSGSEFYSSISSDLSSAVFGVALIVPALATGTPAFAYAPYNFTAVSGEAGIFTGVAANQSGFAIFSNISLASITGSTANTRAAFAPANINSPDFARIQKLLFKLNDKKAKLQLK